MEYTGFDIVYSITNKLVAEKTAPTDSKIINKLSSLSCYELLQIICLGDVSKWREERINRALGKKGVKND